MAGQERVAVLEGGVTELSRVFAGIQAQLKGFEERIDRRFDGFERRLEDLNRRFDDVNRRIDNVDGKATKLFMWAVGVQVMLFTATIGAILAK